MIAIKQTHPDWATVADIYATRFLTLKDGYTHFKHTTHRAIFTRNRKPGNQKKDQLCRLCHKTRESSTHMGQCRIIQTLFSRINRPNATEHKICSALRKAGQGNDATSEILFVASRSEVPLSVGSLLTILWKYTIINWYKYKVDIDRKKFIKDTVWGQAIRRLAELCLVQLAKYRKAQTKAQARGSHEPTTKYNAEMEPLASIGSDGSLIFSKELSQELANCHGETYIKKPKMKLTEKKS
jgi:hypothetical protein